MATISTAFVGDMLFEITMGNHTISIDVPPPMGGSDRGPTPPELFAASLGSCIGAFVATYYVKVGIDTRDMMVDFTFDKTQELYLSPASAWRLTAPN